LRSALQVKHVATSSVELETDKVIFTLLKVGNLLKSSLGEAGLDIISANLRDSSKPFDPMTPGRRVQGAYAFCDVRKFTGCDRVPGRGGDDLRQCHR
jgi:hypothetical protein